MKSLDGQVILITGAGGGFGREMIRQFLALGSRLILADLRPELVEQAIEWAGAGRADRSRGVILGTIAADLSEPGKAAELAERALAVAPIDLLVNNAGIALAGSIEAIPPARWEALMQINLLAPMRLTAALLPHMIARRSGHIANVASVAGLVGAPGLAAYCAAKFGLRGFAEAVAADVRAYGIDVTTIYPFFARTPILNSERFGTTGGRQVPERMLYDPDFVVAQLIDGIRKRKQHVYPGAVPRLLDTMRRVAPWALRLLQ